MSGRRSGSGAQGVSWSPLRIGRNRVVAADRSPSTGARSLGTAPAPRPPYFVMLMPSSRRTRW